MPPCESYEDDYTGIAAELIAGAINLMWVMFLIIGSLRCKLPKFKVLRRDDEEADAREVDHDLADYFARAFYRDVLGG